MVLDVVPSQPVALALAACGLLPVVLVVFSHGPLRTPPPGRRFILAAALTWTAWLAAVVVSAPGWVDLVTGVLLLATATLAGFTLWTLIAWGFTLSMLLALGGAGRPLSVEEWARAHTRGKPLAAFARDRLAFLQRLGLAEVRDYEVVMTPGRGRFIARLTGLLRVLFGLPR